MSQHFVKNATLAFFKGTSVLLHGSIAEAYTQARIIKSLAGLNASQSRSYHMYITAPRVQKA